MLRLTFLFLFSAVLLVGCKNQNAKHSEDSNVDTLQLQSDEVQLEDLPHVYFKASGTEPFWGLNISENNIELKMMGDTIMTPHVEPIRAMDAHVKRYRMETEAVVLTIQISKGNCINAMSGEEFPYAVTINYNYTGETTNHTLQGCGYYTTSLKAGCYVYSENGSEVLFKITDVSDDVYGRLKYRYHEKDENLGNFRGKLYRDKLFGTFTFISEGIESVREVAFLVKKDTLIEGFGALNEVGTAFKFRDSIAYNSKTPLVKTNCK